ncbi:hypothetical protein GEMRC1_003588 [Eukaryota sp. GEM-RC1]
MRKITKSQMRSVINFQNAPNASNARIWRILTPFGKKYTKCTIQQKLTTTSSTRRSLMIHQSSIKLKSKSRGCHLITSELMSKLGNTLRTYRAGVCHLFLQHTSAALSLNENACSDVQRDLARELDRLVPDHNFNPRFEHSYEGDDDMSAHCKSSIVGASLSIPITDGKLALGTWQGIYFIECRDQASTRTIMVTIMGE